MAAVNPPSFMQNVATESAAEARNLITALVPSPGIVGTSDMAVSQHSTGNMSVDVAGGAAFILGSQATQQGTYHAYSDSTVTNLTISAADPTNPRIDRVVAEVLDAFYSGGSNQWQHAVVTGTPTPGATLSNLNGVGAAPANSITLAYVLVPANASSILTADIGDARAKAVPLGDGGEVAYVEVTSSQGSITTQTNITGLSATFTAVGGRKLKITVECPLLTTAADNTGAAIFLLEDGTQIAEAASGGAGSSPNIHLSLMRRRTPAAGSHTYSVQCAAVSGGTVTTNGASNAPLVLMVEDVGAV